jgi:hypothetical protein
VGILIHEKYTNDIQDNKFISESIVFVQLQTDNKTLNIISIYAPEDDKPIQEKDFFTTIFKICSICISRMN